TSPWGDDGVGGRCVRGVLRLWPALKRERQTRSGRRTTGGGSMMTNESAVIEKPAEAFREKILRKCGESIQMKERFFDKYAAEIEAMSRDMAERFRAGRKLLVMGNGGSLCDALHFCVEFTHPIIEKRKAFPVIPLMTDICTMTAI